MTFEFPSKWPKLFGAVTFVVGVVVGGAAVGALASYASLAHVTGALIAFRDAESEQASSAWNAGRLEEAAGHAFCEIEAEHGLAGRRARDTGWALFSLAAIRYAVLDTNREALEAARVAAEAEARARLAVSWEKLGRAEAAQRELAAAVRLVPGRDPAAWRAAGLQTVGTWRPRPEASGPAGASPSAPPNSPVPMIGR